MSSVVHGSHGMHSDGDLVNAFNLSKHKKDKNGDNLANSNDYHFHSTIQHLEDGLQEQFKEQNRNMNKDRENPISSMTDAKFRKLVTTMSFPVFYNIFTMLLFFSVVPLMLSVKKEIPVVDYIAYTLGALLFLNILFDAYVIYRSRKYVIEKVTSRYFGILKNSWRAYESFTILVSIVIIGYFFLDGGKTLNSLDFGTKLLTKIFSIFDFQKFSLYAVLVVVLYLILYYLFIFKINRTAKKEQRISVIESKSSSEHNADVASQIMDGTIDEF